LFGLLLIGLAVFGIGGRDEVRAKQSIV